MKYKILKKKYGYEVGAVVELDASEAKEMVEKGFAEEVKVDALEEAMKVLDSKIEKAAQDAADRVTKKISESLSKSRTVVTIGADREMEDPSMGYKNFAEFALDVKANALHGTPSKKFATAMKYTTGNTEDGAAPDGSVAVPVEYSNKLVEICKNLPNIFDLTDKYQMSTNILKIPVFANYNMANSTVANGIVGNWINPDGATITQSRANFEQLSLQLNKLAVLVPVTDELLDDNNIALSQVLAKQSAYQITKDLNTALLNGVAASHQPTGVLSAGNAALKVVATSTSAADVFTLADIGNIFAGFAHDQADYNSAVWIVHPTVVSHIMTLTGGSGAVPVYTAPGIGENALQNLNVGRLMGRPIIITGDAATAGTQGDISLIDFSKYATGYKGGITSAVSIHLFFDAQMTAFRFTLRVTGKPEFSGPITLQDGSTTVSPYVTLATRS